jgi:hypothetical protein
MNQKWISTLAVIVAVVVGLLVGVMAWWSSGHDPKPAAPEAQVAAASAPASAPSAAASSASRPVDLPGLVAQQSAAAKEIEREPAMKPITGPIKERPAFVSEIEWQMLKGVAQQHATPDLELTHLVNNLRFMKQLELWQGLGKSGDAAKRQTLAEQLLSDLPQRVLSGDMSKKDAQKLQADLLKDAVSDPQARKARAEVEARRLSA